MDATSPAKVSNAKVADATTAASSLVGLGGGRRGPRLPFKIADNYLFGQVVEGTLRGLFWFVGLLMAFAVVTAVRKLVENSLTFGDMIELLAYQTPRMLLFTLPMSVLYGSVQAFADLSTKGEITALGAGGMSLPRMMCAPLVCGALLAILAFFLQETVVPRAERARTAVLARQINNAAVQKDFALSDKQPNGSERRIQAKSFDPRTKALMRPVIQLFNLDGTISVEVAARKAFWNPATGQWKFFLGSTKLFAAHAKADEMPFSESTFEEQELNVAPDPKFMGAKALTLTQNLEKRNFEMVSLAALRAYREGLRAKLSSREKEDRAEIGKQIDGATFGIHDKIMTPFVCLAMVLIGAPLGLRPQRSSGGFAMGLSLAVLILYYVTWTWATQLGKFGLVNPYLMAYFPAVLTTGIGLVLVWKKSR